MTPSPFAVTSPTDPASYAWEATNESVAERFGLPIEQVIRFDLNTSPEPPELLARMLRSGRFVTPLSEYPPGDYRALAEAAAAVYGVAFDELLPGAGADEVLDLCTKAFLAAGEAAVISVPTYAMYRVLVEQRGGRVLPVPRRDRRTAGRWTSGRPCRSPPGRHRLGVQPEQPHGAPGARWHDRGPACRHREDAATDGRAAPAVIVDEAYSEFTGVTVIPLRTRYPNLVVARTASKAYALAGLRVGFAIAAPATIERVALYRPPGSISTISVTVVTEALRDPTEMRANVDRIEQERPRLRRGLERRAGVRSRPTPTSSCWTSRPRSVPRPRPSRCCAAASSPGPSGRGHPLAHCIRITVRAPHENDRFSPLPPRSSPPCRPSQLPESQHDHAPRHP